MESPRIMKMFQKKGYSSLSPYNNLPKEIDVDDQEESQTEISQIELGMQLQKKPSPMAMFGGKDPYEFTIKELQQFCKARHYKAVGCKRDLIVRLLTPQSQYKKNKMRTHEVLTLLEKAGVEHPKKVNKCLKTAIRKGKYNIDGPDSLDQIILEEACACCHKKLVVVMRDALYKKCPEVRCSEAICAPQYVIALCVGKPKLDLRKSCICSIWDWW